MYTENIIVNPSGQALNFIVNKAVALTDSEAATFAAGLLYVGTGGDVIATPVNGTEVTFKNVADGTFLPVLIKAISASTTATNMLICY